jgi:hypothetical protein
LTKAIEEEFLKIVKLQKIGNIGPAQNGLRRWMGGISNRSSLSFSVQILR